MRLCNNCLRHDFPGLLYSFPLSCGHYTIPRCLTIALFDYSYKKETLGVDLLFAVYAREEISTAFLNAPRSALIWSFSLPPVESRCLREFNQQPITVVL